MRNSSQGWTLFLTIVALLLGEGLGTLAQPGFFHLVKQGLVADLKPFRGLLAVPPCLVEDALDHPLFCDLSRALGDCFEIYPSSVRQVETDGAEFDFFCVALRLSRAH